MAIVVLMPWGEHCLKVLIKENITRHHNRMGSRAMLLSASKYMKIRNGYKMNFTKSINVREMDLDQHCLDDVVYGLPGSSVK
jgi:hypothetical protein